jgi:hypothetical protein
LLADNQLGGILEGQAGEITQIDQLRLLRRGRGNLTQRLVQVQQVLVSWVRC